MATLPGGNTMAAIRTVQTGSTSFRGRTNFWGTHRRAKPSMKFPGFIVTIAGAGFLLPRLCFAQADQPAPRTDQNSVMAHAQLLEKAKKGGIDLYFEGDSITRRWGALDYP